MFMSKGTEEKTAILHKNERPYTAKIWRFFNGYIMCYGLSRARPWMLSDYLGQKSYVICSAVNGRTNYDLTFEFYIRTFAQLPWMSSRRKWVVEPADLLVGSLSPFKGLDFKQAVQWWNIQLRCTVVIVVHCGVIHSYIKIISCHILPSSNSTEALIGMEE